MHRKYLSAWVGPLCQTLMTTQPSVGLVVEKVWARHAHQRASLSSSAFDWNDTVVCAWSRCSLESTRTKNYLQLMGNSAPLPLMEFSFSRSRTICKRHRWSNTQFSAYFDHCCGIQKRQAQSIACECKNIVLLQSSTATFSKPLFLMPTI